MRKIAEFALPLDNGTVHCEIGDYDQALHYCHTRKDRREVVLPIRITHWGDEKEPADRSLVKCLAEMKTRLAMLGVHEGQWAACAEAGR